MKYRFCFILAILHFVSTPLDAKQYILRIPQQALANVASALGLTVLRAIDGSNQQLFLVSAPDTTPSEDVIRSVNSHPAVINMQLDSVVTLAEAHQLNQSTVGILDSFSQRILVSYLGTTWWDSYLHQPATRIISLQAAQNLAIGEGTVAVIDTGIDPNHPALSGSLVAGYDFTRNQAGFASELNDLDPYTAQIFSQSATSIQNKVTATLNQDTVAILDQDTVAILDGRIPRAFGHGTMVSGLVHLVCPGCKIMPLKAFHADGTANLSDILAAAYFAADSGAKVINMSFSMTVPDPELQAAMTYLNSKRVISVASVGNSGSQALVYPAAWKKVAGTASTNNYDLRSSFSNYGDSLVSIAAPGEGLITAYPGANYAAVSGTSFSAPLVSGGAGLLAQINANTNQPQAEAAFSAGATPLLGQGLGAGRIDLFQACTYTLRHRL